MITHHATTSTAHDPQAINYRAVRARLMREYSALLAQRDFTRQPIHANAKLARQIAAKEQELAANALDWADQTEDQTETKGDR